MTTPAPLVSILIYNYNYGRFLRECLDSALNQTYPNIEILFSDNASTDDSWQIALEYSQRYPDKIFLARNHKNFGPTANLRNCLMNVRGKYFILLCSDDKLDTECVATAVNVMEAHPDAGITMVHRYMMDDEGNTTTEKPFYSHSCKISPPHQSAVYMMAAVNPSLTQIFYRTEAHTVACELQNGGSHANRYLGQRSVDFCLSCLYPIIYLHTPLIYHRMHGQSDTTFARNNLVQILGPYLLNMEFCEVAERMGFEQVYSRWQSSVMKIASLSLRYAADAFCSGDEAIAKRYVYLAAALNPEVEADQTFIDFNAYWDHSLSQQGLVERLRAQQLHLNREVSYLPPEGSLSLNHTDTPQPERYCA